MVFNAKNIENFSEKYANDYFDYFNIGFDCVIQTT
jgi:hypothetical protein